MTSQAAPHKALFGYLSTWDSPEHGALGGYLVVSHLGRPLEFHCTAPVRTSRAQQILFGPTLWPYVFGEQIGGTLLSEAKLQPALIIVDHAATLCLRGRISTPMVRLIASEQTDACASGQLRLVHDPPNVVNVANCSFELRTEFESDLAAASDLLTQLSQAVELAEPFERIREAIREAQRLGGQGQDAHVEAA